MNAAGVVSGLTASLVAGLLLCSCESGGGSPQPVQPTGPATPDWSQVESRCRQFDSPTQPCPFVRVVYRLTNFSDSSRANQLSRYVRGVAQDIQHDVGPPSDFVTSTQKPCSEGYQRACVAARLVTIEQKVQDAQSNGGTSTTVRDEVRLVWSALTPQRQLGAFRPTDPPTMAMLDEAERHADAALAIVKTAADKAAAEQKAAADRKQQLESETKGIADAAAACQAKPTDCKSKCESANDANSCFAWAANLQESNPPKLSEAKAYFMRACSAGLQSGCAGMQNIDKLIAEAADRLDSLWTGVTDAGDDLAQKYHLVTVAQSVNTRRLQRSIPQMQAINAAIVTEKYCPARKAFVSASTVTEFQRRAAAHCHDQPPTATGLSGAQVTLTAECQQVYATACP